MTQCRCQCEVRRTKGASWTRCGRLALWHWSVNDWDLCDEHARYADTPQNTKRNRVGQLMEGVTTLLARP